ncbi:MAG: hypothetical protein AB1449_13195 [Chloroflexota bacterium]
MTVDQSHGVDLLLAYDWPYDEPFIALLEARLQSRGRSLALVSLGNLNQVLEGAHQGRIRARAYLDRASDTSPEFGPLDEWAEHNVPLHINPGERRRQAWYKTNLHWAFIAAGIHTPYTIAIPSLRRQPELAPPHDLVALGLPFSIKPDLGGGGWGVITAAQSWEDVQSARRHMPGEDLILQEFVEPTSIAGRRGWFRVLYACGQVIPCWWDDRTRLFGPAVSEDERRALGLDPLWDIAATAARIAGIGLFSTEVARVADGRFVVVDYVNDPVDLRFLPNAREGMPGEVALSVAEAIAGFVAAQESSAA